MPAARKAGTRRRKLLAASFVVTFVGGCDSQATAPAVVAPTADVGAAPAPSVAPAGTAAPVVSEVPSAAATAAPGSASAQPVTLFPAPSGGRIHQRADGTCFWSADVICPRMAHGRMMPCNPPPPRPVACPGDAGP